MNASSSFFFSSLGARDSSRAHPLFVWPFMSGTGVPRSQHLTMAPYLLQSPRVLDSSLKTKIMNEVDRR
ncbi:MAG: hypothetical protein J0H77_00510, partial [Alphaproteobacteria bacterium]|nr:hypothetical protein [Alphaproteobacteria bacterium]